MAMLNYWIFNHQGAEYSVVDPPKIDQPARWIQGWKSEIARNLLGFQDWKLVLCHSISVPADGWIHQKPSGNLT